MTRNPELSSIDCASCGAGLDVLGGGRVVVQICPYCGAELDALDDYRVLRQFKELDRPSSPFSLGMRGVLYGAEFVIIGIVQHTERWAGRNWTWLDHQLYSPTHGYAWLTVENGHLVFSRRFRRSVWMSAQNVETSDTRPTVYSEGETYHYYETTTSTITYVEGEFTWRPKLGERTVTVSAMSATAMLGFSQTGTERETYRSVFLPTKEAEPAFGMQLDLKSYRAHPVQPFAAGRNYMFVLFTSLIFCVICLFMAAVFSGRPGQPILRNHSVSIAELPTEIEFPLEANSKLTRITLSGDVHNSWAFLDMELNDPDDQPVFQAGRTIEFYSGRDADGGWSEGSSMSSLYFRPESTGTYKLVLEVPEQGLWSGRGVDRVPNRPVSRLLINVTSGLSSAMWMLVLGGLFGSLFLYQVGRKFLHYRIRWSGSDWVDED